MLETSQLEVAFLSKDQKVFAGSWSESTWHMNDHTNVQYSHSCRRQSLT